MQSIAEDLWTADDRIRQPGGVWLPLRMTVWRERGALTLHSPIAIDDERARAIDALGEVAHVIAPSRLHHLHVRAAAARWPRARVWAPAGVIDGASEGAPIADAVHVRGVPRIDETVYFHRASRTLVCSDLVFHVTRPANLRTRLVLAMMGSGGGRLATSRAWRMFARDRAALAGSLARVLDWDAARIVMGHGEVWEGDVRAALADSRLVRWARG